MTNQEAIRLIRNHPTMCEFPDAYGKPYYDAVDMAISALEFRNKYDQFWEEVKTAGMNGKETEIHHSGRVFRIREIAQ